MVSLHTESNISFHLESCFWPPEKYKSNTHLCFGLYFPYKLVANCVCLLFGAGHVEYSVF